MRSWIPRLSAGVGSSSWRSVGVQRDYRPGMIHTSAASYLWLLIPAGLLQLLSTMVFQMKEAL